MRRASQAEKAERINHARTLLQRFKYLPDAVDSMVRDCSISHRQAYRYLQQAVRMNRDVAVPDGKIAFTVKLSEKLVERLRLYARARGLSLSDVVSRALEAVLPRRAKRG